MIRLSILVLLCAGVFGCARQDFTRPIVRIPLSDLRDSGKPYVEEAKPPARLRMERLAQVLATWEAESGYEPPDYLIGPSDVLEVSIFALEAPDETTSLSRTVSQDGYITLPWVGAVPATGLNPRQLEKRIRAAYTGEYIKDPQVTVAVAEYRSAAVTVTGAVGKPGVYYLTANRTTLLALLAQAGGLSQQAGDELLLARAGDSRHPVPDPGSEGGSKVIPDEADSSPGGAATAESAWQNIQADDFERDWDPETKSHVLRKAVETNPGPAAEVPPEDELEETVGSDPAAQTDSSRQIIVVDLKELLDKGNLRLNLEVVNGDVITVPRRIEEYVYILGFVARPGAYELKDGMRVDAMRAVALAGGLAPAARAGKSILLRETPEGQKVVPVDLTKIARGVRPPLYMQPGDTLVVGTDFIMRLKEFVRPSVSALYSPIPQ